MTPVVSAGHAHASRAGVHPGRSDRSEPGRQAARSRSTPVARQSSGGARGIGRSEGPGRRGRRHHRTKRTALVAARPRMPLLKTLEEPPAILGLHAGDVASRRACCRRVRSRWSASCAFFPPACRADEICGGADWRAGRSEEPRRAPRRGDGGRQPRTGARRPGGPASWVEAPRRLRHRVLGEGVGADRSGRAAFAGAQELLAGTGRRRRGRSASSSRLASPRDGRGAAPRTWEVPRDAGRRRARPGYRESRRPVPAPSKRPRPRPYRGRGAAIRALRRRSIQALVALERNAGVKLVADWGWCSSLMTTASPCAARRP